MTKEDRVTLREANDYLYQTIKSLDNKYLMDICYRILINQDFLNCPASKKEHQAYHGGLLMHTAQVMQSALAMAKMPFLHVNTDILITAIMFHDFGKIYDYRELDKDEKPKDPNDKYAYTDHNALVRHLSRSYAEFMIAAGKVELEPVIRDCIGHVILAHHGRKEWGSPVEPVLTEAYIIHFADMLSAKVALW